MDNVFAFQLQIFRLETSKEIDRGETKPVQPV
jgi:hypothetical protein